jgi:hypothetical protein
MTTVLILYGVAAVALLLQLSLFGFAKHIVFDWVKNLFGLGKLTLSSIAIRVLSGYSVSVPSPRQPRHTVALISALEAKIDRLRQSEEWALATGFLQFVAAFLLFRVTAGEMIGLPLSHLWELITEGPSLAEIFWSRGPVAPEITLEILLGFLLINLAWRVGFKKKSGWVMWAAIVLLPIVVGLKAAYGPEIERARTDLDLWLAKNYNIDDLVRRLLPSR